MIVRDGTEILIPKAARQEIIGILHLTHAATDTTVLQTRNRLFWPRMRAELDDHYTQCKACTENRISRAQKPNEVDMKS